jgi:hypothetical protein
MGLHRRWGSMVYARALWWSTGSVLKSQLAGNSDGVDTDHMARALHPKKTLPRGRPSKPLSEGQYGVRTGSIVVHGQCIEKPISW